MPLDVPPDEPALTRRARRAAVQRAATEQPLTRRQLRALSAQSIPVVEPLVEAPAAAAPASVPVAARGASSDDGPVADDPVDLFIEAARALNFTGQTPQQGAAPGVARSSAPAQDLVPVSVPRRPRTVTRRLATVAASIGAFGVAGLLAVGMTTPLSALAAGADVDPVAPPVAAAAPVEEEEIQAFIAPAETQSAPLERSSAYETARFRDLAEVAGINTDNAFFENDPTADIQWPFAVGVSMSSGFGARWGRLHEGVDFTPGEGAPIQAIADGVVRVATEAGGAYGVHVTIDHVIDGQVVTSHYAHMQYGSMRVRAGQEVKVGDVIGLVGNTGRSYGAHLHFEIRVNGGTSIDPLPWLREHAGRHFPKEGTVAEVAEG
ncbi:M23 family metallopeptidase [Microbacterium album]|uniref:M23ase beta-sheet core domain-containing protein n=1 Tax=Microbacterium album TaxID=2053191 RepID=A0A917MKJ8_9MICO|nr:M23 family metallopeptidase [Microbacterium album]GGH36470.1 hypothetical protein GCM10010921_05660 [Microbacterium album]